MLSDKIFMNMAKEIANGSSCISKQVGTIIVKDGRIISTGYNGTPKGFQNCNILWKDKDPSGHHKWSLDYEIHSEMNAILWASRNGVSIEGSTLYCTLEPCSQCTKNIIASGITRIVYETPYKYSDTERLNKFLKDCNVIKDKI